MLLPFEVQIIFHLIYFCIVFLSTTIDKIVLRPFFDFTSIFIIFGGQEETRTLKPCGTGF